MVLIFKKNMVVGVAITQTRGLEVAQIDFASRTLLKYACRPLPYDFVHGEIIDRDKFKELLAELLFELQIPKGTEVVLSFPTAKFDITDYSAARNMQEIASSIEEDLADTQIFQDMEPAISHMVLPVSTIQFSKVASVALIKEMLIEVAMQIKDLGYKLVAIDTSVGSTFNALVYSERVNVSPDVGWVLLLIEHNSCRVLSMQGSSYVDCFEERISIGEVLGEEENYSIVSSAIKPILKNLPSQCLYVISKTDLISAKKLSGMLTYNAPIVHQEDNYYNSESFLNSGTDLQGNSAAQVSLDVIGAAIYKEISNTLPLQFNLYNASLGDVYLLEQPPSLMLGNKLLIFSMQNMLVAALVVFILFAVATVLTLLPLQTKIAQMEKEKKNIELDIAMIQKFLNANKGISANAFDEGDEIRIGLAHNKNIYSYYTIVGTEIPKKLWLTSLNINKNVTIDGQSDNLESVYGFFRNVRDYNPNANVKLQQLEMSSSSKMTPLSDEEAFETDALITSADADFYEFRISNAPEVKTKQNKSKKQKSDLPDLETVGR